MSANKPRTLASTATNDVTAGVRSYFGGPSDFTALITVVREMPNLRAIAACGTSSAASLLISAQSSMVITLPMVSGCSLFTGVTVQFSSGVDRLLQAAPAILDDDDTDLIDGLPSTSLRRTVTDLARRLSFPDAVAVVDAALRCGVVREDLATPNGYGHARAAQAVAFGDPASESFGESHSRARMRLANIPIPRLQVDQFSAGGRFLGRPDFDWGDGIIGEYDGGSKYDGTYGDDPRAVIEAEKQRQQAFVDQGYCVVRWCWKDLQSPGLVESRIRRALAARPFRKASR